MQKIVFALTVAFILVSCDTGNMDNENKLIGSWENATGTQIETFAFSENEVMATYKNLLAPNVDPITENGTYQYYGSVIIFRMESGLKFFADYSISGDKLTMTFSHTNNTVVYTKK